MGTVDLHYDPIRNLFSLAVQVIVDDGTGPKFLPVEMYVDTGSNRTFLALDKAIELGITSFSGNEMVGGIAGIGGAPVLNNVDLLLFEGKVIHLDSILIMVPPGRKDKKKKGPLVYTRDWKTDPISLFGLDALRKLRGRVSVDLRVDPEGRIDWD
ncbi:MAG: hypothetical protein WCB19_07330 [Thermoplasmata archaeon]